ncbi:MAG TPA: DUF4175 family protein, partial [Gemmatimonadaceae bacterium]|nr:DUF4175 family protein [Gemmatimonadaceae bacterium]
MTVSERLQRERSRLRALVVAAGGGVAVAAVALVLAIGAVALGGARWINLPAAAPFLVWVVVLAAAVERERSLRAGSLRGVLEMGGSSPLARRAEERLAAQLRGVSGPLAPRLRVRLLRDGLFVAAGVAVAALVTGLVAARNPDGWQAVAHPARAYAGTLLPPLVLEDAPPSVLRGEPLTVTVLAPRRREIVLRWRKTGAGWRESRHPVVDDRARVALGAVDADLLLVASDGRATSDTARVRATDRPFLGDVSVRAFYPTYLGRAPETLALGEPARVPRGTLLEIRGSASTALREVALVRDSTHEALPLAVDGRRFSGRVPVTGGGRWGWSARGASGPITEVPPPLDIAVLGDSAPVAEIVAPARDSVVLPGDRVPLALVASDDHAVGQVVLRTWRVREGGRRDDESVRLMAAPDLPHWEGTAELNIAAFGLEPGDELHAVLVATDRSPWRQAGESRELVLRLPQLNEQREHVRSAADSLVARAAATAARQEALARRTDDAARSRDRRSSGAGKEGGSSGGSSGGSAMSYESSERAKALAQEQRQLTGQVQQMQQAAKQLERQLQDAGAMDPALQERLREAQRLMNEALTPELAEKLRQLEQAAQGLNEEQTRRALTDLAQQQQRMREQLEKSVEMLRRAALEGAMETLRDEAQDLAQQQRQMSDSLAAGRSGERSAQDLARRSRELANEVQRLRERLAEQQAAQGAQRAGEAAEHARTSAERMREAAERAARGAADSP